MAGAAAPAAAPAAVAAAPAGQSHPVHSLLVPREAKQKMQPREFTQESSYLRND